jgi:hypothetical protein
MLPERAVGYVYPRTYTLGVDLGQSQDPTAIVAVETEAARRCYYDWRGELREGWAETVVHRVRHAERLPLQLPYPSQVAYVRRLLSSPALPRETALVVDMTGVGRPVFDLFEAEGLKPIGVVITGAAEENRTADRIFTVPKLLLVSRLQASLHAGELKFAPDLAEAQALRTELSEFRMRQTDTGRLTFGAREGRHDDLVLALCVALWHAQSTVKGSREASTVPLLGI